MQPPVPPALHVEHTLTDTDDLVQRAHLARLRALHAAEGLRKEKGKPALRRKEKLGFGDTREVGAKRDKPLGGVRRRETHKHTLKHHTLKHSHSHSFTHSSYR